MTSRPLMHSNQNFLGPSGNIPLIRVCNRNPNKCFENKYTIYRFLLKDHIHICIFCLSIFFRLIILRISLKNDHYDGLTDSLIDS